MGLSKRNKHTVQVVPDEFTSISFSTSGTIFKTIGVGMLILGNSTKRMFCFLKNSSSKMILLRRGVLTCFLLLGCEDFAYIAVKAISENE